MCWLGKGGWHPPLASPAAAFATAKTGVTPPDDNNSPRLYGRGMNGRAVMGGSEKRQRNGPPIVVRCTQEERAAITANADRAGLSNAAFLRAAALGDAGPRAQRRPPADHQALRQILGHLGKIGSNINQIARKLNADEQVTVPELRKALAAYLELRNMIFDALGMKGRKDMDDGDDHKGQQP